MDRETLKTISVRCLAGDNTAWEELYTAKYGHAMAIALATPFRFERQVAEDIAQETMIELTRKLASIDNISGFVGVVTHNKCVDRVRKKKEIRFSDMENREDCKDDIVSQIPSAGPLPYDIIDNSFLVDIKDKLDSIGEPCGSLLYLRFFEEMSYQELSEKVSVPEKQVGVNLMRCLNKLRLLLEKQPGLMKELEGLL